MRPTATPLFDQRSGRRRLAWQGWRRPSWVMALLVSVLLATAPVRADIAVIVHAANPVQSLTVRQVAELYLGRTRAFESGQYAVVVDHAREDPVRVRFFKDISGMSLGQVTAFWSRLKFTGQVQPPQTLEDDAAVLEYVRTNAGAIGYVGTSSIGGAKVKTVLVLRE